jgi:protein phosphatase
VTLDRIAIISDPHGNLPALEATLADIRRREIETIYCLGDLIGKGPDGAAVIDICREACTAVVMGNWDAMVAGDDPHPMNAWAREQIGPERRTYLGALPGTVEFRLSGRRVRLFHASQRSVFHRVRQYDAPEAHLAMFENTELTGDSGIPDIVGYGDIHIAYVKSYRQGCLFNAGSVGNPLDMPGACYAVLEGRLHDAEPGPWSVGIIRLDYDIERAIRDAENARMPKIEEYASELRTARYRGLPPLP